MRVRRTWWFLAGGVVVFAAALLAVVGLAGRTVRPRPGATGPLAVVLLPAAGGSELAVADLESGRVVRRIRLRSLATDISVDASTGLVVAAQSGGIGPDADDAVSVTDVRSGVVRYVTLPVTDPGDVACVAGRAFVLHSVVEASGSVVTVVDVASARVAGGGHVADCAGLWAAVAGGLWTTTCAVGGAPALSRVGPDGGAEAVAAVAGPRVLGVADVGGRVALLGPSESGDEVGEGLVRLMDPWTASVLASAPVTHLARAPRQGVTVGTRLLVGDWSGDEPEGRLLEAFDAATLRPIGPLRLDGVPCALASWGGTLLVVDRAAGRLLVVDPTSGRTSKAIDLGSTDLVFSDVVVIGAGGGPG